MLLDERTRNAQSIALDVKSTNGGGGGNGAGEDYHNSFINLDIEIVNQPLEQSIKSVNFEGARSVSNAY